MVCWSCAQICSACNKASIYELSIHQREFFCALTTVHAAHIGVTCWGHSDFDAFDVFVLVCVLSFPRRSSQSSHPFPRS